MSICERHQGSFSALLDEEIEFNSKFNLQQHLSDCGECSGELLRWREFQAFFEKQLPAAVQSVPDIWPGLADQMPSMCELFDDEISAYLDDELAGSAQAGVRAHLTSCSGCAKRYSDLKNVRQFLAKQLGKSIEQEIDFWIGIKSRLNDNCDLISSELSPFADQEVPNLHHRNIAAHLMECNSCHREFQKLTAVGELLREHYAPLSRDGLDLLPGIKNKIRDMVVAREEKRIIMTRPFLLLGVAMTSLMVLIGSVVAWGVFFAREPVSLVTSEEYLINGSLAESKKSAESVVADEVR